ncbi:MAG: hypothetical protein PHN18_02215 [Sulfurospirillaceae bacterium]|nr:hypothetical protein [Sulfurospirillaceae bacterium]MDD2826607.1 hypothetical protein [Sulfurospirillaceae bacterium]
MRIDNLVRIVEGELQSSPLIDAFEAIHFECQKINRGDLFIAYEASEEAIVTAIERGAYAILTTDSFSSNDTEIAWIKVASITHAIIQILRFTCTQKSLNFVLTSTVQGAFLLALQNEKKIKKLPIKFIELAKELIKAKPNSLFCLHDEILAFQLSPSTQRIEKPYHIHTLSKGLFISTLSNETHFFHEIKIPSLFASDFLGVIEYLEAQHITYSLDSFSSIAHFYPQFITSHLRKKEFGMGEKVLIFETDSALIELEIAYLAERTKRDETLICIPKEIALPCVYSFKTVHFSSAFELETLCHTPFKYALILGDRELFDDFLTRDFSTQPSLF